MFERQAKGVRLTDTGKHFIVRAQAIHNEVWRAQEEIDKLRGLAKGVIHLGLSSVSQIALFPYAAKAFHSRYPDVVLHIRDGLYPTMEPDLKNGTLDLYVGPILNDRSAPYLSVEKLLDNPRAILCRKGHSLAKAKSLSELVDAGWVTTTVTLYVYPCGD